jgi:hypothetical protein
MGGLLDALTRIGSLNGVVVTVGVQGTGATTATGDATPSELVVIATANEFGTSTIPPRPFLRTALKRGRRKWTNGLDAAVRAMAADDRPKAIRVLRQVGLVMVGDTQATLRGGPWVDNAPSTIARKGSSQPLIDTGQLVQSIRAQVEGNGKTEVVG